MQSKNVLEYSKHGQAIFKYLPHVKQQLGFPLR